ncbi:MAG: U32 family peptidase [Coriobacteriia bacterium]|nr:U32 family peptidase [Coriobacteriia bacterium]
MELLAPAGNKDAFYAALGSGADAIFLGTDMLNARRLAQNIKQSELADLVRLAHLFDAKVYLTLNTVILGAEFDQAIELAASAWKDGVDAIIVQDFGLIARLRECMPQVRIHASTQMNIHSQDSLRALAKLGVARVTLSREMSLSDIEVLAAVGREVGIEVEVFGHGALCVSYSGQCLFSSLVGRRSANRGMCAQPCRLPYELIDHRSDVHEVKGPYLLSPKDISSIDYVHRLKAVGVASLKIEGRMKKPAYVAAVVGAYRTALDEARGKDREEASHDDLGNPYDSRQVLTDAFNRALTSGYLTNQHGEELIDYHRVKNESTAQAQSALNIQAKKFVEKIESFQQGLDFEAIIEAGQVLVVEVSDEKGNKGRFEGSPVEVARTKPLEEEDVKTHLNRLGNTPYVMNSLELKLDSGAGMGFSTLHKARREAISDYETHRFFAGIPRVEASINVARNKALRDSLPKRKLKRSLSPEIVAVVGSLSAARAVLNAGANEAHVNAWLLGEAEGDSSEISGIVPVLPRVAKDSELDTYYGIAERFGSAVCSTLGQLETCLQRGIPAQAHWSLNVTNAYTVFALQSNYVPTRIWLSPELSGRQIAMISQQSTVPLGTALFGQQEVMITEACILEGLTDSDNPCTQSCLDCNRRKRHYALRDKKGYCFPISTDPFGRSHIYNSVPLDLSAAMDELLDSGVAALRLDVENALNTQAAKEVARARRNLIAMAGEGEAELPRRPDTVTKGHFFRGVV